MKEKMDVGVQLVALLHGARWMCPGMLLAVSLLLVPPVTKPLVYELGWDRTDARAPFGLAGLVTLGRQL